jgi:hypothetical protein
LFLFSSLAIAFIQKQTLFQKKTFANKNTREKENKKKKEKKKTVCKNCRFQHT